MRIVKLSEYRDLRRSKRKPPSLLTLRREAKDGKIPGAYQNVQGGDWYVDLDYHDQTIRERIESNRVAVPATPQQQRQDRSGLTPEDSDVVSAIIGG